MTHCYYHPPIRNKSSHQPQAQSQPSPLPRPFRRKESPRFSASVQQINVILAILIGSLLSPAEAFSQSTLLFHPSTISITITTSAAATAATSSRGILLLHGKPSFTTTTTTATATATATATILRSTTLNEDGDFCIQGINDDDKTTNSDNNDFTSLLDMEYNQVKDSKLSDILMNPRQHPSTVNPIDETIMNHDVQFETILNDCNVQVDDDAVGQFNVPNNGVPPQPQALDADSSSRPTSSNQIQTASPPIATRISQSAYRTQMVSQDEDDMASSTMESLNDFLKSIFDGQLLPARDIDRYAGELVDIGFDPDCDLLCQELEFDDLVFMKKLHQRFFWKEWQKLF